VELVRPAYDGACISNLVRGIRSRASWMPSVVRDASSVVLLVLDGFAWHAFDARRDSLPTLGAMEGGPITSVLPSTTPTALTSISTGLPPAQHGVMAYRVFTGNGVLNVIRWAMHGGGKGPDPLTFQPREAFDGQPVPVVTRAQFAGTGFTSILYRGSELHGYFSTSGLAAQCRRLVDAGEQLVYAYYDGPDLVAHMHGMSDEFFARELDFCDALVRDLIAQLPSSCAVLVTADHGHIEFTERIELGEIARLVATQAGESRFRYLHARKGAASELHAACKEAFSSHSWIFTREELIDEGLFGPVAPSPEVRRRIGDVVLAASEPVGYVDPDNPGESKLLSGHGSLAPGEMLVPLLGARGTR
jgi:hypothetical protein